VEGPTANLFTATSSNPDEEIMNRCRVLTVDEFREQSAIKGTAPDLISPALWDGLTISEIGPSGPKAGRRPPQNRTSPIKAYGSSRLRVHYMTE
jgi:hypothetical protein